MMSKFLASAIFLAGVPAFADDGLTIACPECPPCTTNQTGGPFIHFQGEMQGRETAAWILFALSFAWNIFLFYHFCSNFRACLRFLCCVVQDKTGVNFDLDRYRDDEDEDSEDEEEEGRGRRGRRGRRGGRGGRAGRGRARRSPSHESV